MKIFSILILALGLLAGCGVKEEKPDVKTNSDVEKKIDLGVKATSEAEKKIDPGAAFLAENARKPGVKTTESGLQYKVILSGTGETPKSTDIVKVHYQGTLIDGTVFDSSLQRGEPISIPVTGVIPGWVEALQMMKVGDKWQLFIPARLAYGDRSPTPLIAPNSTLIFEVELLGIEK